MNSQAEESNPKAKTHALVYDYIEQLKIPSLTARRTIAAHLIPAPRNNGGLHLSNVASVADRCRCPRAIPNVPCQDWRCPTCVNRFSNPP
jgi:hypothetical protein